MTCFKFFIPTGEVSITRDPLTHAGSYRLCEAINSAELDEHFTGEILVFPTQGRNIPNLLGGGDLDGDAFFLCL